MKKTFRKIGHWLRWMKYLNPFHYLKRLDRYIISKFIGTYIYSIILIISISIVFDVNENLAKFTTNHAPLKAIVLDYYANFVPYFANLFSPLFVFIAVIFFTSKLAGNSEIIAMLASGTSFKRLMRPYMISAAIIALLNLYLGAMVIPKGNVVRQNFESRYKNKKKVTSATNVQLQVGKGIIAYIQQYDDVSRTGYGFSLDKFQGKRVVSRLTAQTLRYDTLSDQRYKWTLQMYQIRTQRGMKEEVKEGSRMDTVIQMEPRDFFYVLNQQETMDLPELDEFVERQRRRGAAGVGPFEVEYHKRIASPFAAFILTLIGVSLSCEKRKGGMGASIGLGLALSFAYILFQTVSSSFAINAGWSVMLSVWLPNIVFAAIALVLYRRTPN